MRSCTCEGSNGSALLRYVIRSVRLLPYLLKKSVMSSLGSLHTSWNVSHILICLVYGYSAVARLRAPL